MEIQMKYLFKGRVLNANYCRHLLNSHIHARRVVQLLFLSTLSSKPLPNSKKVGEVSKPNNPQGFSPLFNEILGILGTENIAVDKDTPYGFLLTTQEMQLNGKCRPQGVCGNAAEKTDPIKTETLSDLESSGNGVSDEVEVKDVGSTVRKVTEIVRSESVVLSMEERLENGGFDYNEEVVEKVLKKCFKVPHLALRFFDWLRFSKGFGHTTDTFNMMINVAGEGKDLGLVEGLVMDMEKNSCDKNFKTWTVLVSHYGKGKEIGKALFVFEEMRRTGVKPDEVACRIMLRALCNAGKADLALEFYKDMVYNEVKLDLGLCKQLFKCFAMAGDVGAVHLVGEDMIRFSEVPEPQIYGLMLKSLCIAGRIKESLELIRDLKNKNIVLDTGILETLVKGLCSKDRIADAIEILEIMKRRNVFDQNIYGILISTYLRRNEISEAFNIFQEAKKSGDMSVSTYTNLMQHLFWKNEFRRGLDLYNEMLERGIQLDSVAITTVAIGYAQQNRISEAWEVFRSMGEKGIKPTTKLYTVFIKELCKVSEADEIVKVLNEMEFLKVNTRDDIFRQVISYLEKTGEREKVNAVMGIHRSLTLYPRDREERNADQCNEEKLTVKSETNQLEQKRLSEHCSLESANRLYGSNDVKKVCQILSSSADWHAIQEILEKLHFQFTPEIVVEILRNSVLNIGTALKFFSWVGEQTGYNHNERSYNTALKIAGQGKNFKQMKSLFYEMSRRGCSITSDTWTIMIMRYGRTGLTDLALSCFSEMKLSGCKPEKSTYSSLITSLCGKKGRKVDEVIQIYQEMVQAGFAPDKEIVETYVGCLCEVNKLSDARNCIDSLHKFGFSIALSYSLYVRALCRAGKLDHALALMDEIGSERDLLDQYTYGSLIHSLLRKGLLDEALKKMKFMEKLGIQPTVHVYTALIIHFLKEKEINRALETLEEMKQRGCQPTIVTYSALICGYVRLGKVNDAWDVFHSLKQNGLSPDFKTYSMFIDCLCKIKKSDEAFKLISEMLQNGIVPSTINFRNIIYGLNREGKPNLAQVVLRKKLDLKRRRQMVIQF